MKEKLSYISNLHSAVVIAKISEAAASNDLIIQIDQQSVQVIFESVRR